MNDIKVGKLPIRASYTRNFISKLLQRGKNMVPVILPCNLLIIASLSFLNLTLLLANHVSKHTCLNYFIRRTPWSC